MRKVDESAEQAANLRRRRKILGLAAAGLIFVCGVGWWQKTAPPDDATLISRSGNAEAARLASDDPEPNSMNVATADPGTGLAAEVEGCGLVVAPEDEQAFAEAIARLLDDPDLRAGFAAEARRRAETRWDRTAIIDGFEQALRALVP